MIVTARSFGMNSIIVVIQNIAVVYDVVARTSKINPLLCVIFNDYGCDVIPTCRFEIDAVHSVVLNRAAPNAHIR